MKTILVAIATFVSVMGHAAPPSDQNGVLLGSYIDCYAAVYYTGDINSIGLSSLATTSSFMGLKYITPTKNDFNNQLLMTKDSVITLKDLMNPAELAKKLNKFLVLDEEGFAGYDDLDGKTNFAFYVFTPKGAYTYKFKKGSLTAIKGNLPEYRDADAYFLVKPEAYDHVLALRYLQQSPRPMSDDLNHDSVYFVTPSAVTVGAKVLTGEKNGDNKLYWNVLLKRTQEILKYTVDGQYGFAQLTADNYNNIKNACAPLMPYSADLKKKIEKLSGQVVVTKKATANGKFDRVEHFSDK